MERLLAGHIGVDAGLCWIGDPCYILHKDKDNFPSTVLGTNWHEFCDKIGPLNTLGYQAFPYALGHDGLGVCVSTGFGDGLYPVYVEKTEDGRVARVIVEFINHDDRDLEEEDEDHWDNLDEDEDFDMEDYLDEEDDDDDEEDFDLEDEEDM